MSAETRFDAVIIGAGAAGLMCGGTAGQRGRKALLLERSPRVGQKILISGGGRCNFTNLRVEAKNYLSDNPHFCTSALSRFTPLDFIRLIEKHGIAYHEKAAGQLFCDDRAHRVVDLLLSECGASGVTIKTGCTVKRIEKKEPSSFKPTLPRIPLPRWSWRPGACLTRGQAPRASAMKLPRSSAWRSLPAGPRWCRCPTNPRTSRATGIFPAFPSARRSQPAALPSRMHLLFTHKGLSGPAILQLSSYWTPGEPITIDLLPHLCLNQAILKWKSERPNAALKTLLREHLPERISHCFLDLNGQQNRPVRQLTEGDGAAIARIFHHWQIQPGGTEGYGKAEVTRGGVDTRELSSKTFESRKVPGLYFVGEVLDVTGWLGGYNFQWAWASGHCAGLFV